MVRTKDRTITIKEPRMVALAWWRSNTLEYKKCLMDSHLNDSRYKNVFKVPSITIERIFFKWLGADRSKHLKKESE